MRKKILLTNDDGVHSEGIVLLAAGLSSLGEVTVVAPDRERNATGHSLTLHKPLRAEEIRPRVFAVNGTPTDCVNLAVMSLMKEPPAVLISGINKGGNLGDDVTYSGTVSAAMEGTLLSIPSIAVSQVGDAPWLFETAVFYARRIVELIFERGLIKDALLNVNVPNLPKERIKGVAITALGKRIFDSNIVIEKVDPRGKKYYWIGGDRSRWEERPNSDASAVAEGRVSITPLHLDLTHYTALELLHAWKPFLSAPEAEPSGTP